MVSPSRLLKSVVSNYVCVYLFRDTKFLLKVGVLMCVGSLPLLDFFINYDLEIAVSSLAIIYFSL